MVAIGKVYVTHRQEPERQTLAEEVTDSLYQLSLDSVSCLLPSLFLSLYISFNLNRSSAISLSFIHRDPAADTALHYVFFYLYIFIFYILYFI